MASYDAAARVKSFEALRSQLPNATFLQLETEEPSAGHFDAVYQLTNGQLLPEGATADTEISAGEVSDIQKKLQAIRRAPLFNGINPRLLRMLAFSAQWMDVAEGEVVFQQNDKPDGAYLIYEGAAKLIARDENGETVLEVEPDVGTLVGELGLIRKDPRRLSMVAQTRLQLLRIQPEDFLSIVENDAEAAFRLVEVLIGYLDQANK
jgi:hypothetical protein